MRHDQVPHDSAQAFRMRRDSRFHQRWDDDTGIGHLSGEPAIASDNAEDTSTAVTVTSSARTRLTEMWRSWSPPPTENISSASRPLGARSGAKQQRWCPIPHHWSVP